MSQSMTPTPSGTERKAAQIHPADSSVVLPGPLQTDKGNTIIEEVVVSKVAGMAVRDVPGVYAMGNAARRAFNSFTDRLPGGQTNVTGGVSVEKGDRQAAIDVSVIIEYGAAIVDVADDIRRNVIQAVEQATGLDVVEVNITVSDVHLPGEDDAPADRAPGAAPANLT